MSNSYMLTILECRKFQKGREENHVLLIDCKLSHLTPFCALDFSLLIRWWTGILKAKGLNSFNTY